MVFVVFHIQQIDIIIIIIITIYGPFEHFILFNDMFPEEWTRMKNETNEKKYSICDLCRAKRETNNILFSMILK